MYTVGIERCSRDPADRYESVILFAVRGPALCGYKGEKSTACFVPTKYALLPLDHATLSHLSVSSSART